MEYVECKPACGLDCDCGFVFDCSAAYSCEKRKMAQEEMQIPLFCHIDEEGISVTQGEASSSCKWSDLRKVVYRKNEMYLFTSAIYATIITRNSCEEKFDELVAFVKEKTKK